MTAELRRARAQLAAHKRHHPGAEPPDEAAQLEQDVLDRRIDKLVDAAPRLTATQRSRLAAVLRAAS